MLASGSPSTLAPASTSGATPGTMTRVTRIQAQVLESRDRHEKNLARRTGAWPTTEGTREDALIGRRAEALGPPAGGRGRLRAAAGPPSAGWEGRDRGPGGFTPRSGTGGGTERRT